MRYLNKNSYNPTPLTIRNVMARFHCFLFGHKLSNNTDSGYHYCIRCNVHEYWDTKEYGSNYWENAGWLLKPFQWIKRKYNNIKWYIKWVDNNNPF